MWVLLGKTKAVLAEVLAGQNHKVSPRAGMMLFGLGFNQSNIEF